MLRTLIRSLLNRNKEKRHSRKKDDLSKEVWDEKYANGEWDYLHSMDELGHYSLIVGYCQYLKPTGSLLDVGCGAGVLQQRLTYLPYKQYIGIDISDVAIKKACSHLDDRTRFEVADASDYHTAYKPDIIIFNEILYYFDDVKKVLERYANLMNDSGYFVISMFEQEESTRVWEIIDNDYDVLDAVRVTNKLSLAWNCKVVRL